MTILQQYNYQSDASIDSIGGGVNITITRRLTTPLING